MEVEKFDGQYNKRIQKILIAFRLIKLVKFCFIIKSMSNFYKVFGNIIYTIL